LDMVKRKRIKKRRHRKPKKKNLTFIIFAVVIFVSSIAGYALLSGGTLGFGREKGEGWEPPTDQQLAEKIRNPYQVDETFIAKGKDVYLQRCVDCHFEDGSGPENHPVSFHGRHHSPGDYLWLTTYGIPGSVMKGYQNNLTIEERWQVITYMRRELAGAKE